jgi:glycosyltransferase involved in cell wall biosynthesis
MKLLFAIKALALPGGGAERVLADIATELAVRGHEVVVASFDAEGTEDFYKFAAPIRRVRLGIGHVRTQSGAVETLRRMLALRRLVRIEIPEVAIGFMHSAYIPLCLSLLGSGVPVIASEHIVYGHYEERALERLLLRITTPFVYAYTAITEDMRRGFPGAIRYRMAVIPNPVRVAAVNRSDFLGTGKKVLLAVGRLEKQKDHATLIRAFSKICDLFPEWTLRIVGEGSLRASLELLVLQLGLQRKVILCGASGTIDAEYKTADLFVMPSLYESFGLATAEAMGHGLPAVGFGNCPGTNTLIQDGVNGLLVWGEDRSEALASGLARLMGSPEERARLGAAAPQRLAAFTPDSIVERWIRLARGAVHGQDPRMLVQPEGSAT